MNTFIYILEVINISDNLVYIKKIMKSSSILNKTHRR